MELGKVDCIWGNRISISHWGDGNAAPIGAGKQGSSNDDRLHPQRPYLLQCDHCTTLYRHNAISVTAAWHFLRYYCKMLSQKPRNTIYAQYQVISLKLHTIVLQIKVKKPF